MSINSDKIETVFFSKNVVLVENVRVDGKLIDAIWDSAASINVLRRHPKNFTETGIVTVQSYNRIERQKKFLSLIEIKGKKLNFEYILDSSLPYDALISTETLSGTATGFNFKTKEVVY